MLQNQYLEICSQKTKLQFQKIKEKGKEKTRDFFLGECKLETEYGQKCLTRNEKAYDMKKGNDVVDF